MQLCYALRRGVYYPSQRDAFGEMPPKQYRATYLAKVKKMGFDTLEVPASYDGDAEKHAKELRAGDRGRWAGDRLRARRRAGDRPDPGRQGRRAAEAGRAVRGLGRRDGRQLRRASLPRPTRTAWARSGAASGSRRARAGWRRSTSSSVPPRSSARWGRWPPTSD